MKKTLFVVLLGAATLASSAYAVGWASGDTYDKPDAYFTANQATVSIDTIDAATNTEGTGKNVTLLSGREGAAEGQTATVSEVIVADGGLLKIKTSAWGGNRTFTSLTIGQLSSEGTANVEVEGNHNVQLGTINATLGTVTNSGATLTLNGEADSAGSLKTQSNGVTNLNAALTLTGSMEAGNGTINVNDDVKVGFFASTGNGGSINVADGASLSVSDKSSGAGLWLDPNSVVSVAKGASLSIAGSSSANTLTLTAKGSENAEVTSIDRSLAAKLGVEQSSHKDFLRNVKVSNAAITYTGSDTLYLGTIENCTLKLTDASANANFASLTLNGDTVQLRENHRGTLTITKCLTVSGTGSTVNADLVMDNNSKMDFSSGAVLTMGCGVTIGNNVTIVIDESIVEGIVNCGETVTIIDSVDQITSLGSNWNFVNASGQSLNQYGLRLDTDGNGNIVVAPEPATATLSLLALAALAARRRRH